MADDKKLEIENAETPATSGLNPDIFSQRSQIGQRPTVRRPTPAAPAPQPPPRREDYKGGLYVGYQGNLGPRFWERRWKGFRRGRASVDASFGAGDLNNRGRRGRRPRFLLFSRVGYGRRP